ncbi:hypothetical protein ACFQMJ_27155 [Cohnella cellulosilytica]|uniref:Uncharacterized protein n=1 Tax=Cohnella cellulosilytica TaxID=986710 RepID=A0ABW2FG81_9BACL
MEPWFYIVALGAAIAGLAWMMPKSGHGGSEQEFVSEEAYGRLLEDLEAENRELLDAVAKFKREHDGTTELLGRRIVELEQQMKLLSETPRSPATPAVSPSPDSSFPATFFAQTSHTSSSADVYRDTGAALSPAAEAGTPPGREPSPSAADVADRPSAEPSPDSEPERISPAIRDRYADLLAMHEKGKSVEQIAKATGMNKGEVQLILQLARREERHA